MKIIRYNTKRSGKGTVVEMDTYEAHNLIMSLASQLKHQNPNTGRVESRTEADEYFSIVVLPEKK